MKKPLGIYVHIPFCIQKCHYCDFCSAAASENIKERYASALIKNIKSVAHNFAEHEVDSVFFGGGTPTCLRPKTLSDILFSIKSNYTVSKKAEISLECNPATANYDDFKVLVNSGFNRLSMGVQSVHDKELQALGRIHSFEDFKKTYSEAREAGFDNINLDLMYGIPFQTEESFKQTLKTIISYNPEHISAYALKIEPGTLFFKNKEKLILPDEDSEYNMYKLAVNTLESAGYGHYEISNYAKEGKRSRHNLKYWNADDYIGFGVSAHSCINRNRYAAMNETFKYSDIILNGLSERYYFETEQLSDQEFAEEYIMMRLRLGDGLSPRKYKEKFSSDLPDKYIKRMFPFIKSGHIIYSDERYSLSDDGMYVSNYILSEILDLE